jgi:hypothetical protein
MLPRKRGFFLFPILLFGAMTCDARLLAQHANTGADSVSADTTLVAHELGRGIVELGGPWRFHLGDDPGWADPQFDDSAWERLDAGRPWGEQSHPLTTGFGWYRRVLDVSPAEGTSPEFALLVPRIDDAYEIYWNGRLVAAHGKMPPHPSWYFDVPSQTFGLGPIRKGVMAVRVWKAVFGSRDSGTKGGFAEPMVLGSPRAIADLKGRLDDEFLRSITFTLVLYLLFALVGLLALLLWFREREQTILLWTAGFFLAIFCETVLNNFNLPWPANLADGLTLLVNAIENICLWYLTIWLLDLRDDKQVLRLTRLAAIVLSAWSVFDCVLAIFAWPSTHETMTIWADAVADVPITLLNVWNLVPVAVALRRGRKVAPARWLFAAASVASQMIYVVGLAADQGKRYTHWHLYETFHTRIVTVMGAPVHIYGIADAAMLMTLVYALYRYSLDVNRRQQTLEQEFQQARELQQVLIPESLPEVPGFALTSAYRPAQQVGGDFFQIIALDGGATLVVLGDVSGKGLKAAMAVSLIVGTLRTLAENTSSPAAILAGLNRRLVGRLSGGFATCVALRLEANGRSVAACAGHNAPVLNGEEMHVPGALPLGIVADADYTEMAAQLTPGDYLALCTDGLLEARGRSGELFGFERVAELFETKPSAMEACAAAIRFGQEDDITVLTLTAV